MRERRRYWMSNGTDEREMVLGPLTLDCPFCGTEMGTAAGGEVHPLMRCDCEAVVARAGDPEWPALPSGLLARAYHQIRDRMREDVVGQDAVVDRLALLGARHVHLGGRQRALVTGPSGTGKTTILTSLARAIGCPMLVWDVSTSVEAGWSGVDADAALAELYHTCDKSLERMSRAVIVLDEVCKLAFRTAEGTSREHRRGQQKSLLGLLGGTAPVRFTEHGDRGRAISISTDDMLIIGAGAFEGLEAGAGPTELVRYGYLTEFASRFSMVLSIQPLSPTALVEIYRVGIADAVTAASQFGYGIEVPDAVLLHVAQVIAGAGPSVTPRAGLGWLQATIDSALLRLLDLAARSGARYRIQLSDVEIPSSISPGCEKAAEHDV